MSEVVMMTAALVVTAFVAGFVVGSVFAINVVWHKHGWRPR